MSVRNGCTLFVFVAMLATVAANEQSDSYPEKRHLSDNSKCTLELTCKNKAFKDCDFTGCQDLTKLQLAGKELTGPLPEALGTLVKLSHL